jgi:predicted transcriptional regulator
MAKEKPTFKIVIKKIDKSFSDAFDENLEWLCKTLGFFEDIDRDKTAFSILRELTKAMEKNQLLTSTELAHRVKMSRGSIINHLNNLQRSGLVIRQGRFYKTRSKSIFHTIEEIEADIERIFKDMKKIAKLLDKKMGITINEFE